MQNGDKAPRPSADNATNRQPEPIPWDRLQQAALDCAPDAIISLDIQHRIISWNRGAERLFGFTAQEALGRDLDDLIAAHDPDIYAEAVALTRRMLTGESIRPTERVRFRKGGEPLQVIVAGAPIRVQGQMWGVVAVYTDITERKRAEEALLRAEREKESILDSLVEFVIHQDRDLRVLWANRAACEAVGLRREEVIGQRCYELWATRDDPCPDCPLVLALRSGEPQEIEMTTPDGRWWFVRASPMRNEEGHIVGGVETILEITARKQAIDELRRLKEFHESIVQNMVEGIAIQDADGYLLFVNPAAAAMLGYQPEDLAGKHWTEIVPSDQHVIIKEADRLRRRGSSSRYQVDLRRKDGSRLPVLISGSPRFREGQFVGTLAVFTDISEQIQAEQQLARRAQELAALYETLIEINSQPDLSTLLQAIVRRAAELANTSMGGLYLMRPDGQALDLVVSHNWPEDHFHVTLQLGEGLAGRIAQTGKPMSVADYQNWEGRARVYDGCPVRRALGMPLKVGERVIGVITVSDDEQVGTFDRQEIRLVKLFADQAAIAVENARLLEKEREQRDLADALRHTARSVSSSLDLEQILDSILEQVDRVVPCDAVNVGLLEGDTVHVVRSRGYGAEVTFPPLPLAKTANLRQMRETGRALLIPDVQEYAGWVWLPGALWVRSYVGAPIRVRDRIIGFLSTYSATPRFFRETHAERLQAFADQVGLAIDNARLFQRVERGKREWEATFDAMQDAVVLMDHDHRILRANRSFARLVRRPLPDLIGRDYFDLLGQSSDIMPSPPTDRPSTWTLHYKDHIYEVQATRLHSNGDADGQALPGGGLILVMRDVTVRRQAEEELRRRNRELALLNRVIAASAAGQDVHTILETVCRELAQALDVPQVAAALLNPETDRVTVVAEYLAEERPATLGMTIPISGNPSAEYLLRHKKPLVIVNAQTDPLTAPLHDLMRQQGTVSVLLLPLIIDGQVVGSLKIDATECRHFTDDQIALAQRVAEQVSGALARARLEETQRRLGAAVEQAEEAILITDITGTIIYVNPAFEQLTGYSRAELLGQKPNMLQTKSSRRADYRNLWKTISAGQPWQGRITGLTKEDRSFTVDAAVSPVRNQAGEIVNFVATLRDVTREVELEAQFYHSQKMEALGRMAGGIAHDFNNLLTVIQLSTRILERQLHPADPLLEHVRHIRETGDRAAKLTKQLLRFSRREIIEPEHLNLNQVIQDLRYMLERIAGEQRELILDLAPDLHMVEIDPSQVDQIIMNLVVNACDAMPDGGTLTIQTANVTIEAEDGDYVGASPGEYVRLSVYDTGIGMDERVQAHIFEPFFTTKEQGQGTGLGLPTVFGIVKQNGGHIRVESQVGRGSAFHILLPRAAAPQPQAPLPPVTDSPTLRSTRRLSIPDQTARGDETVLIVEDEKAVRELAVHVLRNYGYRVLSAPDGPTALRLSKEYEGEIHLLLTDIVMPQMSGWQLAEQLRAQRPGLRVLFMSGYADEEIVRAGVRPSGVAFLPKPLTIANLTHRVRAALDDRL